MRTFTDQMGRTVSLPDKPQRIISLVPSQSEYLWDLGLRDPLAGITKFCIHPDEMFRSVPRVGGTKQVNIGKLRELRPDLVIGNKEENTEADIEAIEKEFPVWMSDIYTIDDALDMMRSLAQITGQVPAGEKIISAVEASLSLSKGLFAGKSVAYAIWKDPYMFAGGHTFIGDVLSHCGFDNCFGKNERYPECWLDELAVLKPDIVLLSSEPFPFTEIHAKEMRSALQGSEIRLVDGEMFSWYGSRLSRLAGYLRTLDLAAS